MFPYVLLSLKSDDDVGSIHLIYNLGFPVYYMNYLSSLEASIVLWNKKRFNRYDFDIFGFNEVMLIYYYFTKKFRLKWKSNLIFPEHHC